MIRLRCPKDPKHDRFAVSVSLLQAWMTDEHGVFRLPLGEPEMYDNPTVNDEWTCCECESTADATVED